MLEKPGEFAIGSGAVAIMPRVPELKGQAGPRGVSAAAASRSRSPRRKHGARRRASPDRVQRLELGAQAERARDARRAGADRARAASARSAGRSRWRRSRRACSRRCSRSRTAASTSTPASIRSASSARCSRTSAASARYDRPARSTITQQVARNVFLPKMFPGMTLQEAREKSLRRKLLEIWVSLIITTRASKDAILEMYLNDMTLGQRGSFGIVGVPEAARLFFGKDVSNVTLAEAATIAGVYPVAVGAVAVQQPGALQGTAQRRPAGDGRRRLHRRRMPPTARSHEPLIVVQRALEAEAPYFVDFVGQTLAEQYPGLTTTTTQAVDVYTTLDLHLQRLAQDAVRDGLTQVDQLLSRRKRGQGGSGADRGRSADRRDPRVRRRALLQPVAVQPRHRLAAAAGIGLQAVRLPRPRSSRRARERPHRRHAGLDHRRRAGDVRVRRSGVDAGELRARVRRSDHLPPRARPLAQPRRRSTSRRRPATTASRRSGRSSASARRRRRIRRSRSACSRRRRTRSPPPTRCSRTAA